MKPDQQKDKMSSDKQQPPADSERMKSLLRAGQDLAEELRKEHAGEQTVSEQKLRLLLN